MNRLQRGALYRIPAIDQQRICVSLPRNQRGDFGEPALGRLGRVVIVRINISVQIRSREDTNLNGLGPRSECDQAQRKSQKEAHWPLLLGVRRGSCRVEPWWPQVRDLRQLPVLPPERQPQAQWTPKESDPASGSSYRDTISQAVESRSGRDSHRSPSRSDEIDHRIHALHHFAERSKALRIQRRVVAVIDEELRGASVRTGGGERERAARVAMFYRIVDDARVEPRA